MCMFVKPMLLYVYLNNDIQTPCEHTPGQCFMAQNKTYQLTHIVMAIQPISYYHLDLCVCVFVCVCVCVCVCVHVCVRAYV